MKKPKKIKLTDSPQAKDVKKIPLEPIKKLYDDYGYITSIEYNKNLENENYTQNNSESIQ